MYKLKFSEYIFNDVESSVEYIKNNLKNPVASQRLKNEVKTAYKKIKLNPLIYPAVPIEHLGKKGFKFCMIKNYMLFFKVKKDENIVNIERFLYGPRDWITILGNMN